MKDFFRFLFKIIVTFSIFLIVNAFSKYNNGTSYNAINTISLLATIGLKIANIVIFGIMAYSFITVDIEFLPDYMNIVKKKQNQVHC